MCVLQMSEVCNVGQPGFHDTDASYDNQRYSTANEFFRHQYYEAIDLLVLEQDTFKPMCKSCKYAARGG